MREFVDDVHVLDAARERIDATLDGCDRIAVAYSGGKDSLAVLHLVHERMLARGDDRPVAAVFRDLEFVNDSVLRKVQETYALPWVDGRVLALRFELRCTILGQPVDAIAWGDGREHQHELLPGAITDPSRTYVVSDYDRIAVGLWPGRVIIATGLRAIESLTRYRAIVNKMHEPWLARSKEAGVTMCRPVYDWNELDVLKYLAEVGDRPADLYDAQAWAGQGVGDLRTSSLFSNESMRDIANLKVTDPDAYARLVDYDPDIATFERYRRDLKAKDGIEQPARDLIELDRWVRARFADDPRGLAAALERLRFSRALARRNPDGFPAWWVQQAIARDAHETGVRPLPKLDPRHGRPYAEVFAQ